MQPGGEPELLKPDVWVLPIDNLGRRFLKLTGAEGIRTPYLLNANLPVSLIHKFVTFNLVLSRHHAKSVSCLSGSASVWTNHGVR